MECNLFQLSTVLCNLPTENDVCVEVDKRSRMTLKSLSPSTPTGDKVIEVESYFVGMSSSIRLIILIIFFTLPVNKCHRGRYSCPG